MIPNYSKLHVMELVSRHTMAIIHMDFFSESTLRYIFPNINLRDTHDSISMTGTDEVYYKWSRADNRVCAFRLQSPGTFYDFPPKVAVTFGRGK
jgi:hypothetical protein